MDVRGPPGVAALRLQHLPDRAVMRNRIGRGRDHTGASPIQARAIRSRMAFRSSGRGFQ